MVFVYLQQEEIVFDSYLRREIEQGRGNITIEKDSTNLYELLVCFICVIRAIVECPKWGFTSFPRHKTTFRCDPKINWR